MDYCEVVFSLCDVLSLLYSKFLDPSCQVSFPGYFPCHFLAIVSCSIVLPFATHACCSVASLR